MAQPSYSDLQVAPESQKEVVSPQDYSGSSPYSQHPDTEEVNTLWGLRRRTFWLIVFAIAAVFITAGIGGGVGKKMASKSKPSMADSTIDKPILPLTSETPTPTTSPVSPTPSATPTRMPKSSSGSLPSAMDGTSLAIASWRSGVNNTQLNARLYYQGILGELRERIWTSSSGWSNTSTRIPDIIARSKTPLSQVSLATTSGAREIRLFYLDDNNTICDVIYSNSNWERGQLQSYNFTTGTESKLAAMPWKNGTRIQLYYQDSRDAVQELKWIKNSWSHSTIPEFLTVAKGSGMVALYSVENGDEHVRLYAQTPDHTIISKDFNHGVWYYPYPVYSSVGIPLGTNIAATIVNTGAEYQGLLIVRVYFVGGGGTVRVVTWRDGWDKYPRNLTEGENGSAIVAVDWDENNGRTYFERKEGTIGEMITEGGTNWNDSSFSI